MNSSDRAGMPPVIYVVDDDESMRNCLGLVLTRAGFTVKAFASPSEFRKDYDFDSAGCLVFDLETPEMSGLDLWKELLRNGSRHPLIMITGYGTVPCAVEAMQLGAINFIEKPFQLEEFLTVVNQALRSNLQERENRFRLEDIHQRVESLTSREREVLELVVVGHLSKQIGKALKISSKTVEVHRSNITKKMGVESVAQMVLLMSDYAAQMKKGEGEPFSRPSRSDRG